MQCDSLGIQKINNSKFSKTKIYVCSSLCCFSIHCLIVISRTYTISSKIREHDQYLLLYLEPAIYNFKRPPILPKEMNSYDHQASMIIYLFYFTSEIEIIQEGISQKCCYQGVFRKMQPYLNFGVVNISRFSIVEKKSRVWLQHP